MIKLPDQVELSSPSAERAVWGYNEAQLNQAIADALEEAAKVCEDESCSCCWTEDATEMASHLQDAIRKLKEGL